MNTLIEGLKKEAREIAARALLDGQNQVHDLKSGKATALQIEDRMGRAYDYHGAKLDALIEHIHAATVNQCTDILMAARMGEIDTDLRSLISQMKSLLAEPV